MSLGRGHLGSLNACERPMRFVFRALSNPTTKEFFLVSGEFQPRLRRRHLDIGVVAENPDDGLAGLGLMRDDRRLAIARGLCVPLDIQSQSRLPRCRIRSVAAKAR